MQERFKAWVTRYALSDGILKGEAEVKGGDGIWFYRPDGSWPFLVSGTDWHRTEEAAIQRAEEMRVRKIASLRKQIAKLEAMTFVRGDA